jgi:glycosyltransferase involved in cell wall biosynthesis
MYDDKIKEVVYVGMDLFPPYNEICSKIVHSLTKNLHNSRRYIILSIPNPVVKMASPPDNNYISLPSGGSVISALLLPLYLQRYSRSGKTIIHFIMPAKHNRYMSLLLIFCKMRRIPTIFTLLKSNEDQISCARHADIIVAQTKYAMEKAKKLLPMHRNIYLISCGTPEVRKFQVDKREKDVLFVGIPWKRNDLERRGVQLLFNTIEYIQEIDDDVHFTILNRALNNSSIIDNMASSISSERVDIIHGSVPDISTYYSKSSVFLCLHLDFLCPDPPLSVIEACACGCPIITTRFNSLSEDIQKAGAGVIVETNPQSVAKAINEVFSKEDLYSQNALLLAKEHFDEKVFFDSYNKLYGLL